MKITRVLGALLAGLAVNVSAQDYPNRPIRWVVPCLAGTAPDSTVRIVAAAMGGMSRTRHGQPTLCPQRLPPRRSPDTIAKWHCQKRKRDSSQPQL